MTNEFGIYDTSPAASINVFDVASGEIEIIAATTIADVYQFLEEGDAAASKLFNRRFTAIARSGCAVLAKSGHDIYVFSCPKEYATPIRPDIFEALPSGDLSAYF